MTDGQGREAPSDVVARRIREIRRRREWSAARLAEECAKCGFPQLTEPVINNIESGRRDKHGRRRRDVTVDELDAFARVLGVPPAELLDLEGRVASGRELRTWFDSAGLVVEDLGEGRFAVRRPANEQEDSGDG
jgi:transcriptional regulator with XRE-family HTH domain